MLSNFVTTRRPLAAAALLLAMVATPLAAKEMDAKAAKNVVKEADKAVKDGDGVKARELYRLVITSPFKGGAEHRANALYGLALLEAAKPAEERASADLDDSLARFLKEFPQDKRRPQIAALAGLNRNLTAAGAEKAAIAARLAENEAKLKAYEESAAASSKDSGKKLEDAEAKSRRLQAEVDRLKGELAKQEEALKKLKKVVVGGG